MTDSGPVDCSATLSRAVRVLQDSGDNETARILTRLGLVLEPEPEQWTISGRAVLAYRGVLLAPADLILRLRGDQALREKLRAAIAACFDASDRKLRELLVLLDDPALPLDSEPVAPGHPYRDSHGHSMPHPSVLLSAACACARAWNALDAAELLSTARLVFESVPARAQGIAACRVSILLALDQLALASADGSLRDRMAEAVRTMAQGPHRAVAEVVLAPDWSLLADLPPTGSEAIRSAATLRDLLESEGLKCGVLACDARAVKLLVASGARVAIVEVGDTSFRLDRSEVVHVHVDQRAGDLVEASRTIRRALVRASG